MNTPNFAERVDDIQRLLQSAVTASESSWTDQQGNHFRYYYADPIMNNIRELELGIQSPVDKIVKSLEEIRSIE